MTQLVSYQPTSLAELETFCQRICKTGMVPPAYRNKPEDAQVAILFGNEVGLPPLTSLQSIAVINGRPGLFGDAMPGLAWNKGLILDMSEWMEGEQYTDDWTAVCQVTRPNRSQVEQRFSIGDAKRANLWGKQGPWAQYPRRMLQWRARSWAIRDAAPHLQFGMSAEELQDMETSAQRDPAKAKDITPRNPGEDADAALSATVEAYKTATTKSPVEEVDEALAGGCSDEPAPEPQDNDPLRIAGLSKSEAFSALKWALEDARPNEADELWELYRVKASKFPKHMYADLETIVVAKISGFQGTPGDQSSEVTAAPIG